MRGFRFVPALACLAVFATDHALGQLNVNYSSGDIAVAIPDNGTVNVDVVAGNPPRMIIDMNVAVRISHPFVADLELTLVHPNGTRVQLANNEDGSSDDYGGGDLDCTGDFTIFDDAAPTSISAGSPPYVGSFHPRSSLQPLNALGTKGTWKLEVADQSPDDVGTVHCVILQTTSIEDPYDIDLNGVRSPLTDGLLILRFLFGFHGNTLISDAVGQNCLRCDASSIEFFLTALGFRPGS